MFKTKRRKELERKEIEYERLKQKIMETKHWCVAVSPEIGFAMRYLEERKFNIDEFRDKLIDGKYTYEHYRDTI